MPRSTTNHLTRDEYLATFSHPRKQELAIMILDGSSVDDLNAAGYARINILEAVNDIKEKVEGMEAFELDIPRGEGMDSTSAEDVARDEAATAGDDAGKDSAAGTTHESQVPVQGQPAAPDASPDTTNTPDHTAPSGDEVPGVTAGEPTAHPVETIGGNPVGTLTGEEDAETLQRKADEEKANDDANGAPAAV